jgi:hypothetical protein
MSNFAIPRSSDGTINQSNVQEQIDEAVIPTQALPSLPTAE